MVESQDNQSEDGTVPSYYSQASNTSNTTSYYCSPKECDETRRRLRCIILFKIILVFVTMIGGVVLALFINVWNLTKHDKADIFPGDHLENIENLLDYCQFQSKNYQNNSRFCLDDGQITETLQENRQLYLFDCTDLFRTSQFFHFNIKNETFSKPKNPYNAVRMCLDSKDGMVVLNACNPNKLEQKWLFAENNILPSTIQQKTTGYCLKGNVAGKYVTLAVCTGEAFEKWICLPVRHPYL